MIRYIIKRILMIIPVMLGVSFIVFTMIYFTPGDPAEYLLGVDASEEAVQNLRQELGLNDPFAIRYFNYVKGIVTKFDFGTSYTTHRSVTIELVERFPTTLTLAFLSVSLATIIGIIAGVISATMQYSIFDNIASIVALTGISMPNFWTGLMLIILFAVTLGWLPSSGFESPRYWILPCATIGFACSAAIMRMTRSSMLEVLRQDYITTARAKGQNEVVIIIKHALRNALIPVVTVIGITFGTMLGGAILVESIFAVPGTGKLMVDAISTKNYPMIQGGVLFIALGFSLVNLIVDILYAFIDPRIKTQYGAKI
jgi:peptide/nickel transport system permease protein